MNAMKGVTMSKTKSTCNNVDDSELAAVIIDFLYSGVKIPEYERCIINCWIVANEDNPYLEHALRHQYDKLCSKHTKCNKEKQLVAEMFERFSTTTGLAISPLKLNPDRATLRHRRMLKIAAVLIPLFIIGSIVNLLMRTTDRDLNNRDKANKTITISHYEDNNNVKTDDEINKVEDIDGVNVQKPAIIKTGTILVKADNIEKEVLLPDGSRVILSKGASLEYESDLLEDRTVKLKGNAFFSVAKYEHKKFEVLLDDMTIRVHGTEFYVNKSDLQTEVTLSSGSVEILLDDSSIMLVPNQHFVIDLLGEFSIYDMSEVEMMKLRWGQLKFHNTPLKEVLEQVGEFFDVTVDFKQFENDELIKIEFGIHDDLDTILSVLKIISANYFEYEIAGGNVTITGIK